MSRDRAAYMREYRKRERAVMMNVPEHMVVKSPVADLLNERILELEAEVARLKRELAARPVDDDLERAVHRARTVNSAVDMSFRQFRPAPKSGKR